MGWPWGRHSCWRRLCLPFGASLADARTEGLDVAGLLHRALVGIAIGTALFEEWVFRGVLYAAWLQARGPTEALLVSSAVFGLWHTAPAMNKLRANSPA